MDDVRIAYIDDDSSQRRLYKRKFEDSGEITIIPIDPSEFPKLGDYDKILHDGSIKALIIDKKMAEYAFVPYEGKEIVDFFRITDMGIPIFILTNYPGDNDPEFAGAVEDIISKENMNNRENVRVQIRRILRSTGRYESALTDRERRFSELIAKRMKKQISQEEEIELERIRNEMDSHFSLRQADTIEAMEKNEKMRSEQLKLLNEIMLRINSCESKNSPR